MFYLAGRVSAATILGSVILRQGYCAFGDPGMSGQSGSTVDNFVAASAPKFKVPQAISTSFNHLIENTVLVRA